MKKVFIIHGFEGNPNGGWRPWLMGELGRKDIFACALSMPSPAEPIAAEWVEEISRHVARNLGDDIFLVGHSLGVPAILRYLESAQESVHIAGAVLVAGPYEDIGKPKTKDFFLKPFDFERIRARCAAFHVVHAHDDMNVPFAHAEILAERLGGGLTALTSGAHLNGTSGTYALPATLEALAKMGV